MPSRKETFVAKYRVAFITIDHPGSMIRGARAGQSVSMDRGRDEACNYVAIDLHPEGRASSYNL